MIPDAVRERFPYPDIPDGIVPWVANMDGGGRELVDQLLRYSRAITVLEIGSFLGGSSLRWLSNSQRVQVVAVDPWDLEGVGDLVASGQDWFQWRAPDPAVVQQLNEPEGMYHTFLANLRVYQDRTVVVRGRSERLEELSELGLEPDVIYVDANKERRELDVCRRLWPDAALTGDDYLWLDEHGEMAMQRHVKAFARDHGLRVVHRLHTWVLRETRVPWFWRWLDRIYPAK